MKFGNGCWLQKEGIECFSPKEAYFVKTTEQGVTICAPTANINHRGDTLGGINLTVKITAPAPEVIRVQVAHHLGVQAKTPEFDLTFAEGFKPEIAENEEEVIVKSGSLALRIDRKNWSMRYERGGRLLTTSAGRDRYELHRRYAAARNRTSRIPFRLLLDEGLPLV